MHMSAILRFLRPKWWQGVATMYAGELAANHIFPRKTLRAMFDSNLDDRADSYDIVTHKIHLHSWHGSVRNDKFAMRLRFASIKYVQNTELSKLIDYLEIDEQETWAYCAILYQRAMLNFWPEDLNYGDTYEPDE